MALKKSNGSLAPIKMLTYVNIGNIIPLTGYRVVTYKDDSVAR